MAQSEHVNGDQFRANRQTVRMAVDELKPFAEDRLNDPMQRRHVEEMAEGIKRRGYRTDVKDEIQGKPMPIQLVHSSSGDSFLWNGNHRVAALDMIGYKRKVPVEVLDFRQ